MLMLLCLSMPKGFHGEALAGEMSIGVICLNRAPDLLKVTSLSEGGRISDVEAPPQVKLIMTGAYSDCPSVVKTSRIMSQEGVMTYLAHLQPKLHHPPLH